MPTIQEEQAKNAAQLGELIKTFSPELHGIYKIILERRMTPQIMYEILYKIGIIQQLDDGYGKVIVDVDQRNIVRIRVVQDKKIVI